MNTKMKNLLAGAILIALLIVNNVFAQVDPSTTTTTTTTKQSGRLLQTTTYPYVDVGVMGGVYFPIADFGNNYKHGGVGGVDIGVRLNREVGIYLNGKYYNLPNQDPAFSADKMIEITAGPRYYFTNPKLKSLFFMEAGVGAYIKSVSENTINGTTFPSATNTNVGVNAGPGFSLWLSPSINIILKAKYHVIFTSGYTTNFVTTTAGIDFKL